MQGTIYDHSLETMARCQLVTISGAQASTEERKTELMVVRSLVREHSVYAALIHAHGKEASHAMLQIRQAVCLADQALIKHKFRLEQLLEAR
jgi:hypothetical protein